MTPKELGDALRAFRAKHKPIKTNSGCKVSWELYETLEVAQERSELAKHEAVRMWAMGYDFGYQSPGYINHVPDQGYWVTTP